MPVPILSFPLSKDVTMKSRIKGCFMFFFFFFRYCLWRFLFLLLVLRLLRRRSLGSVAACSLIPRSVCIRAPRAHGWDRTVSSLCSLYDSRQLGEAPSERPLNQRFNSSSSFPKNASLVHVFFSLFPLEFARYKINAVQQNGYPTEETPVLQKGSFTLKA